MARSVSFKADDDFDDKLYSISKKKGMTKSAFIKNELGKLIENNFENKSSDKTETVPEIKAEQKSDLKSEVSQKEEPKAGSKIGISPKTEPSQQLPPKETSSQNRLNSLVDNLPKKDEKKNDTGKYKTKQEVRRKSMSDEHDPDYITEKERYRKFREEEQRERELKDLYDRVKKINTRVCEDGDCLRKGMEDIKKSVEEIKESRKEFQELGEVRKELSSLKKDVIKMEVCPDCGEKSIVHMSSFCSNCGSKINEWTDENGNKIGAWKPYWEKVKRNA